MKLQSLVVVLLLGLLGQACSDAYADRLRRAGTRSRGSVKKAVSSGGGCGNDIVQRYSDWAFTFDGTNFNATTWPQASGSDTDIELSQQTGTMADGQATGLEECGIGSSRVNDGITISDDCYDEQEDVAALGSDIHIRAVLDGGGAVNGDSFLNIVQGGDKIRFQWQSTTTIRARVTMGWSGNFDCTVTVPDSGYFLSDYFLDADGGTGAVATATWCINGTCTACGDAPGAGTGMSADSSLYLGHTDGCASPTWTDGELAFWGVRNTISSISETEHDADVTALGL